MTSDLPRHPVPRLRPEAAAALDRDGCMMARNAVPVDGIEPLRAAFEAGYLPSNRWPVPRGRDMRHAVLDADPWVRRVCRLPVLLAAAGHVIAGPFFLAQVEGREPLKGGGFQNLHRDNDDSPHGMVSALVFLDSYGADNGATRIVPGTHHGEPRDGKTTESRAQTLSGQPGDILVLNAQVLHGGTVNCSGAPRRSLLVSYFAEPMMAEHLRSQALRNVTMAVGEIFAPGA